MQITQIVDDHPKIILWVIEDLKEVKQTLILDSNSTTDEELKRNHQRYYNQILQTKSLTHLTNVTDATHVTSVTGVDIMTTNAVNGKWTSKFCAVNRILLPENQVVIIAVGNFILTMVNDDVKFLSLNEQGARLALVNAYVSAQDLKSHPIFI